MIKRLREIYRAAFPHLAPLGLLLLAATLIFWKSPPFPFVYDDQSFIVDNRSIRGLGNPAAFFTDPSTLASDAELSHDNWRPLVALSFALNYSLGGLDPFGYRLLNLILHAMNAGLVYFLGLLVFARLSRAPALLSKEAAATLPLAFWLRDRCSEREGTSSQRGWLRWYGSYAVLLGIYLACRGLLLGQLAQTGYWGGGLYPTLLTTAKGFLTYLRLLVRPNPLSLEYLYPVSHSQMRMTFPRACGILR